MRQGKVLIFCILLFFIGDVLRFLAGIYELEFTPYTRVSKLIGILLLVGLIIFEKKYTTTFARKIIYSISFLTISFLLGNYFLKDVFFIDNIVKNSSFYLKAMFLPVFIIYFKDLNIDIIKKPLKILEFVFWFNNLFIIVGFILDSPYFYTYDFNRFGFMGVFDRSTYTSYLFVFFTCYYFHQYLKSSNSKNIFKVFAVLLISILVGTKRIYFFDIIFLVYFFYRLRLFKKKLIWIIIPVFFLIGVFFKNELTLFFVEEFKSVHNSYIKHGFLSSITSLRSNLLDSFFGTVVNNHWTLFNYLFGGPFFHVLRPEMDLIDSYLFFGISGPIIFTIYLIKCLFKFDISNFETVNNFLILMVMLFCVSSSGIIFSATFILPAILFSTYFKFSKNE